MIDLTKFSTKSEVFEYLIQNKKDIIAEKKFDIKKSDAVMYPVFSDNDKGESFKAENNVQYLLSKDVINAKIVINTTNLLDSHGDVHIPGLWKKSLREQKSFYHIQEHQMTFDHIISDNVKAYIRSMSWSDLGFNYSGETEALIFDSTVTKSRNEFMFNQYANGFVKNHSVGMRYVNLFLCINDKGNDFVEEKANWDKYISLVANKSQAEESGWFWAVTEAKIIEGSAVPVGSNPATPTISVKEFEPSKDTQTQYIEPVKPLSLFEKLGKSIN